MDDPQEPEPRRPSPPGPGGKPLPRLWKTEPEPEEAPEPPPRPKKKAKAAEPPLAKKKAKKGAGDDAGGKRVLLEETPKLDTIESRRRARLLIGAALGGILLLIGYGVYARFAPDKPAPPEQSTEELLAALSATPGAPADPGAEKEKNARALVDRAREAAKGGGQEKALALLSEVGKKYPGTQAAQEAQTALARPLQGMPLFQEGPGAKSAGPAPGPAPVVAAVPRPASVVAPPSPPLPAARPLPAGFHPKPGSALHPTGWALEILGDRDGAPLVLVPGGSFIQGRDDADPAEGPAHFAKLSTYYIDKHEVTVRQFDLFQKEAGRRADRAGALARDPAAGIPPTVPAATPPAPALDPSPANDLPVVMVSARDAKDYADWAGKRLPTEAQWEMAARSPDNRLHPWGPTFPITGKSREPRKVEPVGTAPEDVSPVGTLDLGGNAWEWTKDWFDPRYYQQFRAASAVDPVGPLTRPRSFQLVVKGGDRDGLATKREGLKVETRLPYLGFRCVLPVEGPGNAFEPAPAPGQAPAPAGAPPGANGELVPF